MRGCEALTSPQVVREFLWDRLGALEHEVFAIIHLDAQNRVIEYVEMFRSTVSQTSVYPREVIKEAWPITARRCWCITIHPVRRNKPGLIELRNCRVLAFRSSIRRK